LIHILVCSDSAALGIVPLPGKALARFVAARTRVETE
jgi:hypothetical protein